MHVSVEVSDLLLWKDLPSHLPARP